jgi:hypothetical protein
MPQQPSPEELLAAVREFVARVDALDPYAPTWGEATLQVAGRELRLPLRAPVAGALVAALRGYHDPRDQGRCDHCGGPRLDANLLCRDCGRPNGLFGQLIAERAARYAGPEPDVGANTSPNAGPNAGGDDRAAESERYAGLADRAGLDRHAAPVAELAARSATGRAARPATELAAGLAAGRAAGPAAGPAAGFGQPGTEGEG